LIHSPCVTHEKCCNFKSNYIGPTHRIKHVIYVHVWATIILKHYDMTNKCNAPELDISEPWTIIDSYYAVTCFVILL